MKVSNSELRMIIMLGAALLLALAYFFGFNKFTNSARELEEQNEADRVTVNNLEAMVGRRAEVEAETEQCRQDIKDIIAKYPSALTTEKAIYIVKDMEDYSGVQATDINFLMNSLLMDFQPGTDPSAVPPKGYYSALTINYDANYDGFKKMVEYVEDMDDRSTIPIISASYDPEMDILHGTVTVNMYFLWGTDKEYEPPVLQEIYLKGVDSIFGAGNGVVMPVEPVE